MAKMSKQDRILSNTLIRALDLRGWIVAAVTMLAVWVVSILLPLRLTVLLSLLGMAASVVGLVISIAGGELPAGQNETPPSDWPSLAITCTRPWREA